MENNYQISERSYQKRDLSDIKTEKLIEVEIKLLETVNTLHTEPEFLVEELWREDR